MTPSLGIGIPPKRMRHGKIFDQLKGEGECIK